MNKEEILRMTNGGLNVFHRYVPGDWREGKNFKNPFYKDTHASFNFSQPPVKPEAVLCVNNSTVAAAGGLVCVTGGSGTGKSNYASALLAGTLHTVSDDVDTLGVQVSPNVEHKAVLLFDTEQSEYQSYCNLERLMHSAGVSEQPGNL